MKYLKQISKEVYMNTKPSSRILLRTMKDQPFISGNSWMFMKHYMRNEVSGLSAIWRINPTRTNKLGLDLSRIRIDLMNNSISIGSILRDYV